MRVENLGDKPLTFTGALHTYLAVSAIDQVCLMGQAKQAEWDAVANTHAIAADTLQFAAEFDRMWGDGPGGKSDSRFGVAKGEGALQEVMVGPTRVGVLFAPHRRSDPNQGLLLLEQLLATTKKNGNHSRKASTKT